METDAWVFNYCSLPIDTMLMVNDGLMFNTNTENQTILCWGSKVHMYFTYAADKED